MKPIMHAYYVLHADIGRKQGIHGPEPLFPAHPQLAIKVEDLRDGMHAGIGPSACCYFHRVMVDAL